MEARMVGKVVVDKTRFHFDKIFDYLIPAEMSKSLCRGCRVLVPFGKGNRKRQGMVVQVSQAGAMEQTDGKKVVIKPILSQIDREPIFTDEMFELMEFMVTNTFCTYYEAIKTILPNAYDMNISDNFSLNRVITEEELSEFSFEERNLIAFLQVAKSQRELDEFLSCDGNSAKKSVVEKLIAKEVITKQTAVKQKAADKTEKMFFMTELFLANADDIKLTPKQGEIADFLTGVGAATKKEILYFCAVGDGILKTLEKKGFVEAYEREVLLAPEIVLSDVVTQKRLEELELSQEQMTVFDGISGLIDSGKAHVALLHGITGSGKTAIFAKLIEKTLSSGRQAMMLVPEIALTPQIVDGFRELFGEKVALMHSNLSISERLNEYKRIKNGSASIVVGTRSAVFAPFENIGLIIMDEEGESSYKSDAPPRYHARELAKLRVLKAKAVLLLASATPSVDSYYKAKSGVYSLFTLNQRYSSATLPQTYIVDMKDEENRGNTSSVSEMLQAEINKNLENHEQCVLFINRRGYNTIARCLECDEVVACPKCDVALTYHKDNGYMMCHYCGYTEKFVRECPACHSEHLKLSGLGTQKIQDELKGMFPKARILRMDADSTYSKYAYAEKFDAFRQGKYDILVGTQMIAKGLDFPNVTLAAVLQADSGLYSADYRAVERVFSLITQVVGRSGRAQKTGRAYIQTYTVDNPVINFAAKQDYPAFYEDEIVARHAMIYPPFCDLCVVSFSGTQEENVVSAAKVFLGIMQVKAKEVTTGLAMNVLGPVEPSIYRLNEKYRQKLLIKCKFNAIFRRYMRSCLYEINNCKSMRNISVYVDVNGDVN